MIAEVPVEEPLRQLGVVMLVTPLNVLLLLLLLVVTAVASTSMDSSLSSPLCSERSLQSSSSVLVTVSCICSSGLLRDGPGGKVLGGEAGLSLTIRTN